MGSRTALMNRAVIDPVEGTRPGASRPKRKNTPAVTASATATTRKAAGRPIASAMDGERKPETAVPTLPAP